MGNSILNYFLDYHSNKSYSNSDSYKKSFRISEFILDNSIESFEKRDSNSDLNNDSFKNNDFNLDKNINS